MTIEGRSAVRLMRSGRISIAVGRHRSRRKDLKAEAEALPRWLSAQAD